MKKVRVNPREKGMMAFDNIGRVIPFRDEGTEVTLTTTISRQIKKGDLVIVEKVQKKTVKKIKDEEKINDWTTE